MNCKVLKQQVLLSESVEAVLNDENVVAFEVDTTVESGPGKIKLDTYKATGIPFIVIEGPGVDGPLVNPYPSANWVINAIRKAQGNPEAADALLTSTTGR